MIKQNSFPGNEFRQFTGPGDGAFPTEERGGREIRDDRRFLFTERQP
jgi:hypothetical protein